MSCRPCKKQPREYYVTLEIWRWRYGHSKGYTLIAQDKDGGGERLSGVELTATDHEKVCTFNVSVAELKRAPKRRMG